MSSEQQRLILIGAGQSPNVYLTEQAPEHEDETPEGLEEIPEVVLGRRLRGARQARSAVQLLSFCART